MNNIFHAKHEPATKDSKNFSLISIHSNKEDYEFVGDGPEFSFVNRYLIELESFDKFLAKTQLNYYGAIRCREEFFNKIQKMLVTKKLQDKGWGLLDYPDSPNKVFLRKMDLKDNLSEVLNLYLNSSYQSVIIVSKKALNEREIDSLLEKIDYFTLPKNISYYLPTGKAIKELVNEDIGLIYLDSNYFHQEYAILETKKQQEILVCYTPWKF